MNVYHEQFGEGEILLSTEKLDESGAVISGDVMFEHGIEVDLPLFEVTYSAKDAAAGEDIGKPGKEFKKIAAKAASKYGSKAAGGRVAGAILKKLRSEEVEEIEEATKGESKVNASIQKMKNKTQKEKVGTDERNSNLQWPLHRVKSDSEKDDERVKMDHYVRAQDKHKAVAKVQMDLIKGGHEINNVKHAGMVKEDAEQIDEKLKGDQHKIDANKNGKIDSEDFKKLRGKNKTDYEDVSSDSTTCESVNESTETKPFNVTPATNDLRMPGVENTVREIMSQQRNLRQEAKIEEFKNRNK